MLTEWTTFPDIVIPDSQSTTVDFYLTSIVGQASLSLRHNTDEESHL